jgi:YfiH family protein
VPSFLTSRLLSSAGVVHGFSTRRGGVSSGPFASLNVSAAVGDDGAHVAVNLSRLARAAGADASPFATVTQVHGDRVLLARLADGAPCFDELLPESDPGHERVSGERGPGTPLASANAVANATATAPPPPSADAVLVTTRGLLAAVRVADCVPILLHDPRSGASAAVHSGWRGARLSIAARGVQALSATSAALPGDVLAAIGPCIGRCCYEVSAELAAMFRALFGDAAADDPVRVERPHLNLRACVAAALLAAGVRGEHLEQVPGCTSCEPERFFSHRRDRGVTGRMLGFIAAR